MSDVLKMAITCSVDCLEQAALKQPGAIIVGTGMGCPIHTKSFLDKILSANGGLIAPTAFITSTHNTIAGQISLLLKNHGYNSTHTQNSLSFEQALLDGMLCLGEGCRNVLVGAADEEENELFNMNARLHMQDIHGTGGASFFILDTEKTPGASAMLADTASLSLIDDLPGAIAGFLKGNNVPEAHIDLVLYSQSSPGTGTVLASVFGVGKLLEFQKLSGIYFTNSAFAVNYAVDVLSDESNKGIRNILVCNNLVPENLGLTLLKKVTHEFD